MFQREREERLAAEEIKVDTPELRVWLWQIVVSFERIRYSNSASSSRGLHLRIIKIEKVNDLFAYDDFIL